MEEGRKERNLEGLEPHNIWDRLTPVGININIHLNVTKKSVIVSFNMKPQRYINHVLNLYRYYITHPCRKTLQLYLCFFQSSLPNVDRFPIILSLTHLAERTGHLPFHRLN